MKIFQVILLIIFGFGLLLAVLIFSGVFSDGGPGAGAAVDLTIWGTLSASRLEIFTREFNQQFQGQFNIDYVFVPAEQFELRYLEALARDANPDLIFLTDDLVVKLNDTIWPVPLENFSVRNFQDTFIAGAEIFLTPAGLLAMPLAVDPLVMYVNKDLYTNAGLPLVPKTWTEFISVLGQLNKIDNRHNISQSAVAMGEFSNNKKAKLILTMLIIQAGNPIAQGDFGLWRSVLKESFGHTLNPTVAALNFFTQMADQSRLTYSWNRSMVEAQEAFSAGILANYFGLASDLPALRNKNPNLNLDVAVVPQRNLNSDQTTLGRQIGLAVVRKSANQTEAFQLAFLLSSADQARKLTQTLGLSPARRDLLASSRADAFSPVFNASALISRTWPDPDPQATSAVFKNMAEKTLLKQVTAEKAVADASEQVDNLFKAR